ncbi:MAG: exodeoxyribonuclease VII large subunit, partial [Pedobacter sp.]
ADSIIRALDQVFQYENSFDVVVIIRGGGAQLDLASFDHYELAYHVAQFPIPVITGIGHDKDETIVDLVAHTKMKTPTAVAEFLISGAEAFEQRLLEVQGYCSTLLSDRLKKENDWLLQAVGSLKQGVRQLIREEEHQFNETAWRLKNSVPAFVQQQEHRFVQYSHRLQLEGLGTIRDQFHFLQKRANDLQVRVQRLLNNRDNSIEQIRQGIRGRLTDKLKLQQNKLSVFAEKIRLFDPFQVLKRGYSLTYHEGKLVRSVQDLTKGDQLVTRLYDGTVKSKLSK